MPIYATTDKKNLTVPLKSLPVLDEKDERKKNLHQDKVISILLADDHKIIREGLANILKEKAGFQIIAEAENGVEACEKASFFQPDVIIMDINMPQLNGIEATRLIKKDFPHIQIIGLSVQDENDVSEAMKKAGAVTLLNKAGEPEELIKAIIDSVSE